MENSYVGFVTALEDYEYTFTDGTPFGIQEDWKRMKTIFIDVMHKGRFIMTLPYKHNPLFKIDIEDVYAKIIEKRPTLRGKHLELYFD